MKLIATDMDGTLLNSKQDISPYTIQTLKHAQDLGIGVILVSGRDIESLKRYGDKLDLALYPQSGYICLNGLEAYNSQGECLFQHQRLQLEDCYQLEAIAKKYQLNLGYFFDKNTKIIKHNDSRVLEMVLGHGQDCLISSIDECQSSIKELRKAIFNHNQKYVVDHLDDILKDAKDFDVCRVEPEWLEVNPFGINKGQALKDYCQICGVHIEETIAFGNGDNDISMLEVAGISVAMDNSFESVKKSAQDVCQDNDNDGLAQYLNQKILKEPII